MPLRHLKDSRAIFLQTGGGGGGGTLTDAVLSLNGIQDHINLSGTGNVSGVTIDIIPTGSGILISGSGITFEQVENYLLNTSPTFLSAVDDYVADIDLINGLSGTNGEVTLSGLGGVQVTTGTGDAGEDVVYISGDVAVDINSYWQKTGDDLYYESGNVAIGGLPVLKGAETFVVSSSGGAVFSGIDVTIKDGTGIAHDKILVGTENQIESGVALYSHQITISGNPVSTGYASGINIGDIDNRTHSIYAGNSGGLHPSILQFKTLSGTGGLEISEGDDYLIISGGAGGGTVKDVVFTTGDQTGISGKKTFLDDLTVGDNLSGYIFQVEDETVSISGVLDVTGQIFLNGKEITGGGGGGGEGTVTDASNIGLGSGLFSGTETGVIKLKSILGTGLLDISDQGDGETLLLSGMDQYTTGAVAFGTGEELAHFSDTGIRFASIPTVSGIPLSTGGGGGGEGTVTDASNIGLGTGLVSGTETGVIKLKSILGTGLLDISDQGDGETLLLSGMDQYTTGAVAFGTGEELAHFSDTGIRFASIPTVSGIPLSTGGTSVVANPGASGGGIITTITIDGTDFAISGHSDAGGGGGGTASDASNIGLGTGLVSGVETGVIKLKSILGTGLLDISDQGDGETLLLSGMDQYTTGAVAFGTGEELMHVSSTGIRFASIPTVSGIPLSTGGGGTSVVANPGASGGGIITTITIDGTDFAISGHSDAGGGGGGEGTVTDASNIGLGTGLVSGTETGVIKLKSILGTGLFDISDQGDGETLLISGMDQYTTGAVAFGTGQELAHFSDTGIRFASIPTVSGIPLSTGGGGTSVVANPGASGGGSLTTITIGGTDYAIVGGGGGGGGGLQSGTTLNHANFSAAKSGEITFIATGATGADGQIDESIATIELIDGGENIIAISGIETGRFLDEPKFNALFDFYPRNNPSGFVRHNSFSGTSGIVVTSQPDDVDSLDGNIGYTVTMGLEPGAAVGEAVNIGLGTGLVSGVETGVLKVKSILATGGLIDVSDQGDGETVLISGLDYHTTGAVAFGTGEELMHVSSTGIRFAFIPTVSGIPLSTGGGGTSVVANPGASGGGIITTITIDGTDFAISGHSDAGGGGGGGAPQVPSGVMLLNSLTGDIDIVNAGRNVVSTSGNSIIISGSGPSSINSISDGAITVEGAEAVSVITDGNTIQVSGNAVSSIGTGPHEQVTGLGGHVVVTGVGGNTVITSGQHLLFSGLTADDAAAGLGDQFVKTTTDQDIEGVKNFKEGAGTNNTGVIVSGRSTFRNVTQHDSGIRFNDFTTGSTGYLGTIASSGGYQETGYWSLEHDATDNSMTFTWNVSQFVNYND